MLTRVAGKLSHSTSGLFFKPCIQKRFFSLQNEEAGEWLKMATKLENKGKIRAAEDIYKEVISEIPTYQPAYQKLWELWTRTCSLKVTQKEMDNFIKMYEIHVSGKESATPPPSPNV